MTHGQSQVRLLSIREFAQVCRTTPRTLRFYEQKGLFKPAKIDAWNKYRLYDPRQARDFLKIKLLQNFHVPLKDIRSYSSSDPAQRGSREVFKGISSRPASPQGGQARTIKSYTAEQFLQNKLKSIQEEIREKEKEYKFLKEIRSFLFQQDINDCHAELDSASSKIPKQVRNDKDKRIFQTKTFGPFNLFCMKVEHGEYAKITDYIKILWQEARRLKLNCESSEITFYLNNAYNPRNTPLEIALILQRFTSEESLRNTNDFYFKPYPKTKALVYNYIGPYEYLILVYQKLFSCIENQKIKLKGLVFEKYKYGPLNTKSKYDYQTVIGFPI